MNYLAEDTIAAISTALGGAISMVRVSGPEAFSVLGRIARLKDVQSFEPRKSYRASLYAESTETNGLLDDALFVRFVQPQSYTGENLVEFHIHGSAYIAQRLMETLMTLGARQALPGEFSFRAVRNGKMNLFQAQAITDLISATNDKAISLALEKLSGSQNAFLSSLAEQLRKLAALAEVGIDFADQDVEEVSLPQLKKQVSKILEIIQKIKDSFSRGIRVQEGLRVAFVGLPNAGKSSFFNLLLGEDRSIVSEIAGTTRDVIREKLTLRNQNKTVTLRLEDTAGLRKTDHPIEKIGIERTHQTVQEADLILFIVDPSHSFAAIEEQWQEIKRIHPLGEELSSIALGILTKSDRYSPEISQKTLDLSKLTQLGIPTENWVITSAHQNIGVTETVSAIIAICEKWTRRDQGELIITRLDHFHASQAALNHLQRALHATEIDLFASDIRQALHSLTPLIGETPPDEILGRIFSDFCIGK